MALYVVQIKSDVVQIKSDVCRILKKLINMS